MTTKTASTTTTASTIKTLPRDQITSTAWAVALLETIKAPVTQNNVSNLLRWMQLEGGSGTNPGGSMATWLENNDPLNSSLKTSGKFHYTTVEDGIANTAATIKQSNMSSIYDALKSNVDTASFSKALASSSWDGSNYSKQIKAHGADFLNFFPELAAFATTTGTNPTSTSAGALGFGSQPSTSITGKQFAADVPGSALAIGKDLAAKVGITSSGKTNSGAGGWLYSYAQMLAAPGGALGSLNVGGDATMVVARAGTFLMGFVLFGVGLLILVGGSLLTVFRSGAGKTAEKVIP
jgi:hypothetical protein